MAGHPFSPVRTSTLRWVLAAVMACAFVASMPLSAYAAPDSYEPDDVAADAKVIAVDGTIQEHTTDPAGDYDYVKFDAVAGHRYIIENGPPVARPDQWYDMGLWLYDGDGTHYVDWDDDSGPGNYSRIGYTATVTGTLYIKTGYYNPPGLREAVLPYRLRVIDATTYGGATIEGHVSAGGLPLSGADVALVDDLYGTLDGAPVFTAVTAADGTYSIPTDMIGRFRVIFTAPGWMEQYFDLSATRAGAAIVSPAPGTTVSNVDAVLLPQPAPSRLTFLPRLASITTAGDQGWGDAYAPSLSRNGALVAFESNATTLVAGDTNGATDIFVRDLAAGTTTRVSVSTAGAEGTEGSYDPAFSADGHKVAFSSDAWNFVPSDDNDTRDIFVKDLQSGETTRASVAADGSEADGGSYGPTVSADGRYVVFETEATNLVSATVDQPVIVRKDMQSGETTLVSQSTGGDSPNARSYAQSMSADGRYVVFTSRASNLVSGDTNRVSDVFLRDCQDATTVRISVSSTGVQGSIGTDNGGGSRDGVISGDGRFVAFMTRNAWVADDTNDEVDVYVRELATGAYTRANLASGGAQAEEGADDGVGHPWLSDDGRFCVFESYARDLVAGEATMDTKVYMRDMQRGLTGLVSTSNIGMWPDPDSWDPVISGDGSRVAFGSRASNLVFGDVNGCQDVFVADRDQGAPVTTSDAVSAYGTEALITLTATDTPTGGSGVATTNFTLNGGTVTLYTGPISVTAPGTYTLRFWSSDVAGNVEVAHQVVFTVGSTVALGRPVSPYVVRHGRRFTVYGTIRPRQKSRTYPVQLQCYRLERGEWVLRRTFRARAYYGRTVSKYAQWIRLPYAGHWKIVAVYTVGSATGTSAPRYMRIR